MKNVARAIAVALVLLCMSASSARAGRPGFIGQPVTKLVRPPTGYVDNAHLAANTAKAYTVATFAGDPGRRLIIVFSGTCTDYYIRSGGTAAVPSGDVTDGTSSDRNPAAYAVLQADVLSVISPANCDLSLSYYFGDF